MTSNSAQHASRVDNHCGTQAKTFVFASPSNTHPCASIVFNGNEVRYSIAYRIKEVKDVAQTKIRRIQRNCELSLVSLEWNPPHDPKPSSSLAEGEERTHHDPDWRAKRLTDHRGAA
jgi:hypothetical protein